MTVDEMMRSLIREIGENNKEVMKLKLVLRNGTSYKEAKGIVGEIDSREEEIKKCQEMLELLDKID